MESKEIKKMVSDAITVGLEKRAQLQEIKNLSEEEAAKLQERVTKVLGKLPGLITDSVANGYSDVQFLSFLNKREFESEESQHFIRAVQEALTKAGYKTEIRRFPDGSGFVYVVLRDEPRLKEGKSWLSRLLGA